MQLYMNYEETVNYLKHLEAHFNGQCMSTVGGMAVPLEKVSPPDIRS